MFAIFLSESMNPFYQNISSFPTVFFTFFLLLTMLYWLVAVLGFVDIDILDFDIPDVDGDLGVNADSGVSTPDVLAGLMLKFGLQGVPVTVIVSLISLFGWLFSYYIVYFFFGVIPAGIFTVLAGIPTLMISLYLGVMITSVLIKPLRPLFQHSQTQAEQFILGQTAIVRTSRVDNEFGEVLLDDDGAGLILNVRSIGDARFKKGDKVVLLEYVKENNIYHVISEQEFSGT